MKILDIEKIERQRGIASTVQAESFIPLYAEAARRFLRDNQSMGNEWVRTAGSALLDCFKGKNNEGDVLGLNIPAGVAIATFLPEIPLITGQQLYEIYKQAGNKNPFGEVYIDFGIQINGEPKINSAKAKVLLDDFKARGIEVGEGRVPNFGQLRIQANQNAGLVYNLADDVSTYNIKLVSAYPFEARVRKDGLFRASLDGRGWSASGGGLLYSDDGCRVVRYDAEGVARAEPRATATDLVSSLIRGFLKTF